MDSFLSHCERTERKRKHSYNFAAAGRGSSSSTGNLFASAKNYSKTLPRSFRKNLQKISQLIRETGDGDFYDLNHNHKVLVADKVISMVDLDLCAAVELLANRSLEEKRFSYEQEEEEEEREVSQDDEEEEIDELENNSKCAAATAIKTITFGIKNKIACPVKYFNIPKVD